ncbi:MAG TPA: PKD domain-containing protein, partial [Verrucomicrobiales bacterium]|nr:PKD domain-containing protein [Verrucomicrobiales bacterium]
MKKTLFCLSCTLILCGSVYHLQPFGKGHPGNSRQKAAAVENHSLPAAAATVPEEPVNRATAAHATRKAPDFQAIHAFSDWLEEFTGAAPEERPSMTARGAALAKARRPEFQRLIRMNPQLALEIAVRPVVRQDLPPEVVEQLEKPVSARGDYKAYFGRVAEGVELPPDQELVMRYFETPEGQSYKAHVYGALQETTSRKNIAFRGVAVDRELAVSESPVRQLDTGERIPAGTAVDQTCPVSNITTKADTSEGLTVSDDTPVVELAGRLILLCNGTHVRVFDEAERQASGGPGVAGYFKDTYPGTSSEAIGNFRCLYIRVTYPDQLRAPNSEATAHGDMRNVSRYYLESSFGRLTTTSTVTPLIVMPHTKAWYIAKDDEVDGLGLVHSDARSEARRLGYDSNQYNCTIVRVNEGPRLSGISWGGGDSVWVSWDGMDVLDHECGHSLGRNHANFWQTSDGSAIGVGANQEYGNSLDVMGGGGGFGAHYNSYSKRSLGWLPDNNVNRPGNTPASNGVYRLYAYDQPLLEEGKRYSFRVDKDPQRRFYLEYHPAAGGQWVDSVTMIMSGLGSNAGHLIDTTPGSPGGKGDGGIRVGRTFSDFESDLHFTVLGKNATTPPSMDVAMMRGPFPGNLPPVATLNASAISVAVGGSLTFTATASDPNGDPLAYSWDFSDNYASTNTPVLTRTFPTTDQQTVELTVSDMKGGVVRRNVVITVGNPGRAVVRGHISAGGVPLMGVRVTSDTDKYCYTDVNGDYALADLQTGSRTLEAKLTGYTFTAGFTNPLALTTAGATAQNWTAASVPELTIAATNATEGGAAGSFVISRTGD